MRIAGKGVCGLVCAALALFAAGDALMAVKQRSVSAEKAEARSIVQGPEEAVFRARYAAVVERGLSPGRPLSWCEACVSLCAGKAYRQCRQKCAMKCGLEEQAPASP